MDFPRIVMFEKVHPFVSSIIKSLTCELMDTEFYYYGKNLIVYQESKIVGEKIYGKNIVLARVMYFDMAELKWIENKAIFRGIISRTDWFWLTSQCFNYYICKLKPYVLSTGMLFIHNSSKFEMIKCFIKMGQYISLDKFNIGGKNLLFSDDLPVRKCIIACDEEHIINRTVLIDVLNHSLGNGFYAKDFYDKEIFSRQIKWWQEGIKNTMKTRLDIQKQDNIY